MGSNTDLVRIFNDAFHSQPAELICDVLHKRFKQDQPYTQLGHHRLLVVNPYKHLELLNDATLKYYINNGYKDLANSTSCVEPHIYDFATRAYYVMRRKEKDVAILLSGISGSGKSTTHLHILKTLLLLSTHTRRETKLQRQILAVQTILGAFGTATSADNRSASRLAQLNTLYFNERGRIAGSYTASFLLDKQRVTRGPANFDIFYQLLAGTTAQEKAALHISHPADHFYYLKDTSNQRPTGSNDEIAFNDFKEALKTCGIKAKATAQICQLLAAILHLGNIQFVGLNSSSTPSESCRVKNKDTLSLVAAALGVATTKLEATLTHKLKLLGKEFCTAFLTVETATLQRDGLARALYSILVLWMVDTLNSKLAHSEQVSHCITTLDSIGFSQQQQQQQYMFHDLVTQFCTERIRQFSLACAFEYPDASGSCLPVYQGIKTLVNAESERLQSYAIDATDANLLNLLLKKDGCAKGKAASGFVIQHFAGPVEYSVEGMLEGNLDALSPDFILLFRYNCTNAFLRELFESPVVSTETHPRDERTIIKAQLYSLPERWLRTEYQQHQESEKKLRLHDQESAIIAAKMATVLDQAVSRIDSLVNCLSTMHIFEVFHIRPNAQQKPSMFDADYVKWQLEAYRLVDYARRPQSDYMYPFTFAEFLSRYYFLTNMLPFVDQQVTNCEENKNEYDMVSKLIHVMQWTEHQVVLSATYLAISFDVWRDLENHLRTLEKEARIRQKEQERLAALEAQALAEQEAEEQRAQEAAAAAAAAAMAEAETEAEKRSAKTSVDSGDPFDDIHGEARTDYDFYDGQTHIHHGSEATHSQWGDDDDHDGFIDMYGPNMDMSKMVVDHRVQPEELVEEVPITRMRQWWARFVWFCTWWIPSFLLRWIGKMQRQDVQMAWREKVTLCLLIFLFSASIIFFIVGLGPVLCPGTEYLFTSNDVSNHQTITDYWVSVRGKVYDMTKFVSNTHGSSTYMATKSTLEPLAGRDLSYTFPPPLTNACAGLVTDASVTVTPNETIVLGPFVHFSGPQQPDQSLADLLRSNWYSDVFLPKMDTFQKGDLVVSEKQLRQDFEGWGRLALSINGKIYDITDYMATARRYPRGSVPNYHYLDEVVENFFKKYGGKDATQEWAKFSQQLDEQAKAQNMACLDNAFYIGRLDFRDSMRCTFVNYLLLSFACVMSLVIVIKFLAALQFGGAPTPEDQDKFVICQVPCYTEDEDSLRKTIDSLTTMMYDDKRKLLFLIADGMIIGSGNDKPTPRILLDILGHDDKDDPEPVMFKSVGEGSKQLNYGKVYSGLYFHGGHSVPYIVVVKVGKSTEQTKPGNRGKRDSQIICMDFLNKVHFNAAMTPLELELYRHFKHVIGVDPALYEYILMVDSDTEVYPDALTRLVSCMLHDSRIIGLCGETELCNEDKSWTTRIQVYEYYISHHLVKAFESLFGSVTCLPGCFCMYRIRTPGKREPLIISPAIIHGYSDNQVDTLHKKNLLHLGEDRYLTTLMMKTFPQYKMVFTPYARCRTVAPDRWHVLLSQRRRWINSTIHNLLELLLLPELCGFCCLSMRFVVMIDLVGTITLPSSVIYLVYLIYVAASGIGPLPVIALGMLAGAYGLQALIFIFKRQWQHIGWMVIYLLAIPVFSFFIPIYAFWHFDDFSWGNTRVVVGDKKKQIIVTEDEKFDIKMIPLKKWEDYEQELLETQSVASEETAYILEDLPPETRRQSSHSIKSLLPRLDILDDNLTEQKPDNFSVDLSVAVLQRAEEEEDKPLLPEDDEIEREVRRILATSNLMTLTKKQVRIQLSQLFGVDLTIKKDFINSIIDSSI